MEQNQPQNIKQELLSLAEPKFQAFTARLMPGVSDILGVRLPILRKIAKRIVKQGDGEAFLKTAALDSFEEILLKGMVIGALPGNPETIFPLIRSFLPCISNWAVCDSFCSSLKIAKRFPEEMWEFILPCLHSEKPFEIRFGLVMLLDYFTDAAHAAKAFALIDAIPQVKSGTTAKTMTLDEYYVKMAAAWCISIYYIRLPEETASYLACNQLDDWTYNKALQKIMESRTISPETREKIKAMKR